MNHILRPYQKEAENNIRLALRQGRKAPLLVMPTGSGKTHIFTSIATQAEQKGNRSLIIVHRSFLWKQVSDKLTDIGVHHGIIAPGHTRTADKIQIASIDTLIRRLDKMQKPDIIIYDEAHHVIRNNKWGKVAEYWPDVPLLGVTATPCRTNGQGLGLQSGGFFDELILGSQMLDLTPEYIAPYKLFAPKLDVDVSEVKRIGGDWDRKELAAIYERKKIYGSVPGHYKKICYGIPAIAFCVTVKHAEWAADEFKDAGITAASVSGKTPEKQRKYLFESLARGRIMVLCSCDLVSEGFDVPVCGCAINLRHTQSLTLCLQQWGRASRPYPGKEYAYILDHVGNYTRHGMPDAMRTWSLEGSRYSKNILDEEGRLLVRTCPMCFNVHAPCPMCPKCGYKYVNGFKLPKVDERVELQEIETARIKEDLEKHDMKHKRRQCRTLDDLKEFGKMQVPPYKDGWAGYIYKSWEDKGLLDENGIHKYR
jgi:superfamily II DNA or RNA helicase